MTGMQQADYLHLVRMSELDAQHNPAAYRRHVMWFAALGYAYALASVAVGALMLLGAAALVAHAAGPAHAAWLGAHREDDAAQTAAAIEAWGGTDVLVIDHYAIDQRWENLLRPYVGLICVIDDLAHRRERRKAKKLAAAQSKP